MAAADATCAACGATPAAVVSVRRHVGMVILQKFVKVRTPLCRNCGRELVKDFTLKTLYQGWWGYISFFVNWFVLATNAVAWFRFRKLAEPVEVDEGRRTWASAFDEEREPEHATVD